MRILPRWHHAGDEHFDAFLREAISAVPGSDKGLGREELFGLYTSWCLTFWQRPQAEKALWRALGRRRITPGRKMLAMTGPAAANYIISVHRTSSEPPSIH